MLIGLLADPHANLPALEAVLDDVDAVGPDLLVCLGDLVGYGAEPNEVVAILRDRCDASLAGNHDLAALAIVDVATFNPPAALSALWTAEHLSPEAVAFLGSLPSRSRVAGIEVAHGSLRDPVAEYVTGPEVAAWSFAEVGFSVAAVGHTHVPAVFVNDEEGIRELPIVPGEPVETAGARALLNPGGVGQPRDGDPRAAWGVWDGDASSFTVRRVAYDIERSQRSIRAAGLPELLAERLAYGW